MVEGFPFHRCSFSVENERVIQIHLILNSCCSFVLRLMQSHREESDVSDFLQPVLVPIFILLINLTAVHFLDSDPY